MCTAVILKDQKSKFPFIISFNRDELFSRKTLPPGRHWKDFPSIIAGKDNKHGGTWFGINDFGVFSCLLNRNIHDKTKKKFISRGQLVLDILKQKNLDNARKFILNYNYLNKFDGFNLLISDSINTFWLKHSMESKKILISEIKDGISIITDKNCNNFKNKKIYEYFNYFNNANPPNPEKNDWKEWSNLMVKKSKYNNSKFNQNICFNYKDMYGTVSCSQLAFSIDQPIKYRYSYKYPLKKNFYEVLTKK